MTLDNYQPLHHYEEHSCMHMSSSLSFSTNYMMMLRLTIGLRQKYMPAFQTYDHCAVDPTEYSTTDNIDSIGLLNEPALGLG